MEKLGLKLAQSMLFMVILVCISTTYANKKIAENKRIALEYKKAQEQQMLMEQQADEEGYGDNYEDDEVLMQRFTVGEEGRQINRSELQDMKKDADDRYIEETIQKYVEEYKREHDGQISPEMEQEIRNAVTTKFNSEKEAGNIRYTPNEQNNDQ